jgi:hypothetical protein
MSCFLQPATRNNYFSLKQTFNISTWADLSSAQRSAAVRLQVAASPPPLALSPILHPSLSLLLLPLPSLHQTSAHANAAALPCLSPNCTLSSCRNSSASGCSSTLPLRPGCDALQRARCSGCSSGRGTVFHRALCSLMGPWARCCCCCSAAASAVYAHVIFVASSWFLTACLALPRCCFLLNLTQPPFCSGGLLHTCAFC